jgi:hypothetical protein
MVASKPPKDSLNNRYPTDENVMEAKRLLLEAAEKWHMAGNAAAEERVRVWEKNVKTQREFLASLPNPGSNVATSNRFNQFDRQWTEEEKLIHDPIDYQMGNWTTGAGNAFAVAKFSSAIWATAGLIWMSSPINSVRRNTN